MNPRERVKNAMNLRVVDAIPRAENFYEETVTRFFAQGLPAQEIAVVEWKIESILQNWPKFTGFDPYSHFGCVNFSGCTVPVDLGPIPRFKQRKIAEDSRYEEYVMESGARIIKRRARETTWYAMPMFYAFPVTDRKNWDQYKERLDPEDYLEVFDQYQAGPTLLAVAGF